MRKTLSILFLLAVALCGQASAQLSQCAITATIYDNNGDLLSGARIVVVKVVKNGSLISNTPLTYTTNASGVATFNLPRSSVAWIWANSYGLNANGSAGVAVTVPNAASANCEELAAFSSVLTTLGDLAYGGASGVFTRLAGNTSTTAKFLCQQGNGTTSTAPGWCAFVGSGNLTLTYDNNARTATFGYEPSSAELLAALGSQSANRVLASPDGSSGTMTVRALALGDVPTITNAKLQNSSVTIGSTAVSLGATAATIAGLTLTTPTIASFNNANHSHTNSTGGGQLTTAALTGLGTGVDTALGVNVGSAGAFVTNGGALGTPSSGVGSNLTALNASNLGSGTVPLARLSGITTAELSATAGITNGQLAGSIAISKLAITGTPNGAKFLRDDGSWQSAAAVNTATYVPYSTGGALADSPLTRESSTELKITNAQLTLAGPTATNSSYTVAKINKLGGHAGSSDFYWTRSTTNFASGKPPDEVMMLGYNLSAGGGAVTAGETAIGLAWEGHYEPVAGTEYTEFHLHYVNKAGTQLRPISYRIDKNTDDILYLPTFNTMNAANTAGRNFWTVTDTQFLWRPTSTTGIQIEELGADLGIYRTGGGQIKFPNATVWMRAFEQIGQSPSVVGAIIQAAPSQTADLLRFRDQSENVMTLFDAAGKLAINTSTATYPITINASGNGLGHTDGTRTLTTNVSSTNGVRIGSVTNHDFGIFTNNASGNQFLFRTNGSAVLAVNQSGTTIPGDFASQKGFVLSNTNDLVNKPLGIAFGGYTGYLHGGIYGVMTNDGGGTTGDVIIAQRALGSDTDFTQNFTFKNTGRLGIGTASPGSKLQVTGGDVYVDTIASGLVLKSPDGTCYRATMANGGTFSISSITCP